MDVTPFSLDLSSPLATASGPIERRSGYLVRIEADGAVGLGECVAVAVGGRVGAGHASGDGGRPEKRRARESVGRRSAGPTSKSPSGRYCRQ